MKYIIAFSIVLGITALVAYFYFKTTNSAKFNNPIAKVTIGEKQKEKPLEKYKYEVLSNTVFSPSEISLGDVLAQNEQFVSRIFYFNVDGPSINSGQVKKVRGLINIPTIPGNYPVIVLIRGYVDQQIYQTGVGTQRIGEELAKAGYITLAADFLGYGQSDNPSDFPIEERFQTYTTVLTLLTSVKNLNQTLLANNIETSSNADKIGIWGHSNGGHIAISTLEISGASYPTVLWAPVTKPFPYSILYYTDEFDDRGKELRKVLAQFEADYNVDDYDPMKFLGKINAPLQLHQGTADDAVPVVWSNDFVSRLGELGKNVDYFTYQGADHNLLGGWDTAVARSTEFFDENLK